MPAPQCGVHRDHLFVSLAATLVNARVGNSTDNDDCKINALKILRELQRFDWRLAPMSRPNDSNVFHNATHRATAVRQRSTMKCARRKLRRTRTRVPSDQDRQ